MTPEKSKTREPYTRKASAVTLRFARSVDACLFSREKFAPFPTELRLDSQVTSERSLTGDTVLKTEFPNFHRDWFGKQKERKMSQALFHREESHRTRLGAWEKREALLSPVCSPRTSFLSPYTAARVLTTQKKRRKFKFNEFTAPTYQAPEDFS